MNVNPEIQFIDWLAKLRGNYRSLIKNMKKMKDEDVEKKLKSLKSNWESLQNYCEQHKVDYLEYRQQILELRQYHYDIMEYLEDKPRDSFHKSIALAAKIADKILEIFHLPTFAVLSYEAFITIFPPISSPSVPLLTDSNYYDERPKKEIFRETTPSPITHPTPRSTPSPTQNTRPPEPQKEYSSETTPVYIKFSTTRTMLSQDIVYKNSKGIMADIDVIFKGMENINCKVQLSYWLANGKPIKNKNEGSLAMLEKSIIPNLENYEIKNAKFFMAYKKLSLGIGLYKCKVRINAIRSDNGQVLGNPQEIFFELSDPNPRT